MSAVRLFRSGSNKLELTNDKLSSAIRLRNDFNTTVATRRMNKGIVSGHTEYDTPSNASPAENEKINMNKTVRINANRRPKRLPR